jgi:hypothetical protein
VIEHPHDRVETAARSCWGGGFDAVAHHSWKESLMTTETTAPVRIVDLPIYERRHLAWRPLNELDLEIAAQRTHYTITASPRAIPVPPRVNEALFHIVRLTHDGRRGTRVPKGWNLLLPDESEARTPDDFPIDPVGVAAWPWRRQIQLERWEARAVIVDGGVFGPLLLIGVEAATSPAPTARAL